MQISAVNSLNYSFSNKKLKQGFSQQKIPRGENVAMFSRENLQTNFMNVSFKSSNPKIKELKDYVSATKLNQFITNKSFYKNPNFDAKGWLEFFTTTEDMYDYAEEDHFLNVFVNEPDFNEKLNDVNYSPTRALAFITEFISNDKLQGILSAKDVRLLMDYFAKTDYELKDFTEEVIYFKNLKDKDGKRVLTSTHNVFEMAEQIIYMMQIDRGSVSASNFEMLLELITRGQIDSGVLKFMSKNSELTPDIISDVDKLYQAYSDGKKPIDVFVPVYKTEYGAKKSLSLGEVYLLEGNQNVSIIGEKGKSIPLNISREMYFDLFPPVQRFSTTQNIIGNCWEISALNSLYSDPKTRIELLKLFKQDGRDIVVEFPKSVYGAVRFENAQMPSSLNMQYYSRGAKGFNMLEYADGKELYAQNLRKFEYQTKLDIKNATKEERLLVERIENDKKSIVDENKFVVLQDEKSKRWYVEPYDAEKHKYNDPTTLYRHFGYLLSLYKNLGCRSLVFSLSNRGIQKDVQKPLFFDKCVVCVATKGEKILKSNQTENNVIDYSKGLLTRHAYRLLPVDINGKGKITDYYLINPYGGMQVKISKNELLKYGDSISLVIKDKNED